MNKFLSLMVFSFLLATLSYAEKLEIKEFEEFKFVSSEIFNSSTQDILSVKSQIEYKYNLNNKHLSFNSIPNDYNILDVKFKLSKLNSFELEAVAKRLRNNELVELPENQLYREFVSFDVQKFDKNYSFISFRLNDLEDPVWLYSPFVNSKRKISQANKADELLGTSFSLNDLFTWSEKEISYNVISKEQVTAKIFVDPSKVRVSKNSNCNIVQIDRKEDQTSLEMRDLIKYTLVSLDVNSKISKVIVYFDSISYLPVYKFLYSKSIKPYKVVINKIASTNVISSTDIYTSGKQSSIEYNQYNFCKTFTKNVSKKNFDPVILN